MTPMTRFYKRKCESPVEVLKIPLPPGGMEGAWLINISYKIHRELWHQTFSTLTLCCGC